MGIHRPLSSSGKLFPTGGLTSSDCASARRLATTLSRSLTCASFVSAIYPPVGNCFPLEDIHFDEVVQASQIGQANAYNREYPPVGNSFPLEDMKEESFRVLEFLSQNPCNTFPTPILQWETVSHWRIGFKRRWVEIPAS